MFSLVLPPVVLVPLSLVPEPVAAGLVLPALVPEPVAAGPSSEVVLVPAAGLLLPEGVSVLVQALAERPSSALGPAGRSVQPVLPELVVVELAWQVVPLEPPEGPEYSG